MSASFEGRMSVWSLVGRLLFRATPHGAYRTRNALLRLFGASVGKGVRVRRSARIDRPWNLRLGDRSMIGDRALIVASRSIAVGRGTTISQGTMLLTNEIHSGEGPIQIGDGCWIAADVVVLPGSEVGDGTVVGARSQVVGRLPEMVVSIGVPALPVRQRDPGRQ